MFIKLYSKINFWPIFLTICLKKLARNSAMSALYCISLWYNTYFYLHAIFIFTLFILKEHLEIEAQAWPDMKPVAHALPLVHTAASAWGNPAPPQTSTTAPPAWGKPTPPQPLRQPKSTTSNPWSNVVQSNSESPKNEDFPDLMATSRGGRSKKFWLEFELFYFYINYNEEIILNTEQTNKLISKQSSSRFFEDIYSYQSHKKRSSDKRLLDTCGNGNWWRSFILTRGIFYSKNVLILY